MQDTFVLSRLRTSVSYFETLVVGVFHLNSTIRLGRFSAVTTLLQAVPASLFEVHGCREPAFWPS